MKGAVPISNLKRNFLYNSIYQILAITMPLITMPYLSRILGASGIGKYAYAYAVAYYFSLFIKLGIQNYGSRTIAIVRDNSKELSETFWNIYAVQIFQGLIVVLLYYIYIITFTKDDIIAVILYMFIFAMIIDVTWFFYGIEEFKTIVIRDILIKIATMVACFVFVREKGDIWKYAFIMSLGYLLSYSSLWLIILKKLRWVKPSWRAMKLHVKPTWILFLPTIAVSLYKIMDKIMLGAIAGNIETGFYESCEKIICVPTAIVTALGVVMLPHMSNLYSKKFAAQEKLILLIEKSEHFLVSLSATLSFGIMSVAAEFVPVFYGSGYEKCVILFYLLLPSCIFLAFANVIRTQFLIPNKMDKEYILSLFAGATINLVVNTILIPKYQSIGAVIGTALAECIVCVCQVIFVKKYIPIMKIGVECSGYVFISMIMFLIGVFVPVSIDNLIVKMMIKIVICGICWSIMMFGYLKIVLRCKIM